MTDWRKGARAAVRTSLQESARFSEFKRLNIWTKSINAEDLPSIGCGIPRETSGRDSHDSTARMMTLAVVVKRVGGDLEDLADDDAAEIEGLVMAALDGEGELPELTETTYSEDNAGQSSVSTLALMFNVTTWPADPLD
ncbi:hypothetical protein [Pelagimonas varians]|uniref:Uncharacterized protein n=1 Tax=Pelagimonas varians TaxID=696760 RepID=A0A238JYJ1_9RHOB|nr:hypothetical protein [Pelagimonas varians]PYG33120.1 hypothetical protein C8N36_102115 [Pelagimonas varians]SMX35738.1 hypothetical protein PEV8663_00577 [Pelagimonas varians]